MIKKLFLILVLTIFTVSYAYADSKDDKQIKTIVSLLDSSFKTADFYPLNKYLSRRLLRDFDGFIKDIAETQKEYREMEKTNKEEYNRTIKQFSKINFLKPISFAEMMKIKKKKDIFNIYMQARCFISIIDKNADDTGKILNYKYILQGLNEIDDVRKDINYQIEIETEKEIYTRDFRIMLEKYKGKWYIDDIWTK